MFFFINHNPIQSFTMKKRCFFILLLFPLLLQANPSFDQVHFLSGRLSDIQRKAATDGKLYVVYFTAGWCMPCQWMEKNTFTDRQLSSYMNSYYLPYKVDIDDVDGYNYKQQYEIVLLPSFLIFNSKGELLDRFEESLSASKMLLILQSYNTPENRQYSNQPYIIEDAMVGDAGPSGPSEQEEAYYEEPQAIVNNPQAYDDYDSRNNTDPGDFNHDEFAEETPKKESYSEDRYSYDVPEKNASDEINAAPTQSEAYQEPSKKYTNEETTLQFSSPPEPTEEKPLNLGYGVQVGAFSNHDSVKREAQKLENRFNTEVFIFPTQSRGKTIYKMVIGSFPSKTEAVYFMNKLKKNSVEGFVKRLADF